MRFARRSLGDSFGCGTSWGGGWAAFTGESKLQAKWVGLGLCAVPEIPMMVP